jgi:uncharacterized protein YdgA (DUF945 family)
MLSPTAITANYTRVATLKKRIILVLSSITLVIGSTYFLSGKLIQEDYYETISKLSSRKDLKVSLISYNRGLFHSHAKLEIETATADAKNSHKVNIHQTITHGPLVAVNTPKGFSLRIIASQLYTTLDGALQQNLCDFTNNSTPLQLTTVINFSKQATTWISLAATNHSSATGTQVSWGALNGEIAHDLNFVNYSGEIAAPNLTINTPEWSFNLTDSILKLDASKQDNSYSNINIIRSKILSFNKFNNELIKLDDISVRLEFTKGTNQNLGFSMLANVIDSKIGQRKFAQDSLRLQIVNINPSALPNLPQSDNLSPKSIVDFVQGLTANNNAKLNLELPKQYTEALLSIISYELYRNSLIGKFDRREDAAVMRDITNSINAIVQSALKQQLFIEQGAFYALNFDRKPSQA